MIDFSKTAVFHNTQYSASLEVAEYYADARGIPAGNVHGFAFSSGGIVGTDVSSRDAFLAGTLTDIKNFIAEKSIESVALSICCPLFYGNDPQNSILSSLCRTISDSDRIVHIGGAQAANTLMPLESNHLLDFGGVKTAAAIRLKNPTGFIFNWRDAVLTASYRYTLCGRLGYSDGTLANDSIAVAKRCIDDSIWSEQNSDPRALPILFGMSTRASPYLEHANVYAAWRTAVNMGCAKTLKYDGNISGSSSTKWGGHDWGYQQPQWDVDAVKFLNGKTDKIDLWGWVGTGLENNSIPVASTNLLRGAWVFESTSDNVSGPAILHGATSAVCPLQEPYTIGLPEISGFIGHLLKGFSVEEACVMSCGSHISSVTEVWGDPFYTPFKRFKYGEAGKGIRS